MTHIIAKTYSVIGNATCSIPVDTIVVPIQQKTGAYMGLTGNIVQDSHEEFHILLQQQLKNHPPAIGECFFIQRPHRPERTFDNVLYVADDEVLSLSIFTELILCKLVRCGCTAIALPPLRYHQESASKTMEAILDGIRDFQESYNAPLHIYLTLGKHDSIAWKCVFDQTKYCGEWCDGRFIA